MKDVVKIGCSLGFWGDTNVGAFQLVDSGIDYLVGDYLAEVTMGILARMKNEGAARGGMGDGGFVSEFVYSVWKPLMGKILAKNIKVIVNAGGMNPLACKKAIEKVSKAAGLTVTVACVTGDDLMDKKESLKEAGKLSVFSVESAEEPLLPEGKPCLSFNAYLGAKPIQIALQNGAQVVVTGRCVDSALILGPLMHEFNWSESDFDLLAAGSVGGHIIECGCQCTGGNFTDWEKSAFSANGGWANAGFPILEVSRNGDLVVTKPANTGGIVSWGSVVEQIVYEIHDPARYYLPDVIVDFTNLQVTDLGNDRVSVKGAKGYPPTKFYKISSTYFNGYWIAAELLITGFDAKRKSQAVAEAILKRSSFLLKKKNLDDFTATNIEFLGNEHTYGSRGNNGSKEVILRISVHHQSPEAIKIFGREIAPSATGMAPGITGAGSGRPRPAPFVLHAGALVNKEEVPITITLGENDTTFTHTSNPSIYTIVNNPNAPAKKQGAEVNVNVPTKKVPLIAICYGRSGDKGDVANVGIIARDPQYYPWLQHFLTAESVHSHFSHFVKGTTTRYELPGIRAFNFVLTKSLGGGGLNSLHIDRQGKSYAQNLLTKVIDVPASWDIPKLPFLSNL